jgi:hypothetical protein
MKKVLLVIFIAAFLMKTTGGFAQVNKADSLALVDLYNSTAGASWTTSTNWLTTASVSTWSGITVTNNRVTEIALNSNNLVGNIPVSIGNISNLVTLYLYDNTLSDTIPASIGNLSQLKSLEIYKNYLSGAFPATIGNCTNLQYLYIDHNDFTGNLPSSIGNLSSLIKFEAYLNYFSGPIPSSLGLLSNLTTLYLDGNDFSGTIPSSLEDLTSLTALGIYNNELTFAGMEGLVTAFSFAEYSPQDTIQLHYSANKLSVSAGGTLANDTFRWYNGATLVATNIGDSVYPVTALGNYSVAVTNAVATALTLYSDTVMITSLPVKLLNFTATKQGGQALLQWTTEQEVNSKYFSVERSSDGVNFSSIGQVNALGTSSVAKTYSFTDAKPTVGTNYYRLRMVDKDGQFAYSQTRSISIAVIFDASIFPNPVQNNLNLSFSSGSATAVQVEIINNEGKKVASRQVQVAAGASTQTINTASLSSGTYYVRLISAEGETELKFVKQQ